MPNRVDGNVSGARPVPQRAEQAAQPPRDPGATAPNNVGAGGDRVEISNTARARSQELAAARQSQQNAQAPPAPAGEQGAVNRSSEENAARLREGQEAQRQPPRDSNEPPVPQGNVVDLTG